MTGNTEKKIDQTTPPVIPGAPQAEKRFPLYGRRTDLKGGGPNPFRGGPKSTEKRKKTTGAIAIFAHRKSLPLKNLS